MNRHISLLNQILLGTLTLVTIFAFQDCGQGMSTVSSQTNASSSTGTTTIPTANSMQLLVANPSLTTFNQLAFSVYNLPDGAMVNWSHTLNTNLKCTENTSASSKVYTITCSSTGILAINAFVTQAGKLPSSLQRSDLVTYQAPVVGPTPVPTPYIPPTPPPPPDPVELAKGQALVQQYCVPCHNTPTTTSVRYTSAATLTFTIQAGTGGMGSLSGLTSQQRDEIALALSN